MDKFNNMMGVLATAGGIGGTPIKIISDEPTSDNVPDTDSDIGETGKINDETSEEKVILHIGGGIEIHLPLEIARQITEALGGSECSCGANDSEAE